MKKEEKEENEGDGRRDGRDEIVEEVAEVVVKGDLWADRRQRQLKELENGYQE